MHKKESKNYLIFGHKYYQTSIDSKSYDKKSILKTIHKNFNVSSNRNKFDDSLPVSSNMHHSLYDRENSKYKEPDYSSLIKIYRNTFSTFLESISTKSKLNFDFEIVSYTCTDSSHFMRRHNHLPTSDFSSVHYISFDKDHSKTVYYNPGSTLAVYNQETRKKLYSELNSEDLRNHGYYEYFSPHIEEDYLVIVPSYINHEIPSLTVPYKKPRITLVTNLWIK